MILDGWGEGRKDNSNAIYTQGAPNLDALRARYPYNFLKACGEDVGLPDGQMGNSEVGHLNIGAGRIVYQDLVKINHACRDHSFLENKEIKAAYDYVKESGKALHFFGLCSHGGVHSSLNHLYEFLEVAKNYGLQKVYVHCFMDGRDCAPTSGKGFIEELQGKCEATGAKIASIVGRFYAMDRDKRWERVKLAYDLLVEGKGDKFSCPIEAMQASYDAGVTDEFVKPVCITNADGTPVGTVGEGDAVIFYNFRNARPRAITSVLTQEDMPAEGMHTIPLYFCTLTPYDDSFKGLHILFDKENVPETLGEIVSKAGMRQLRIAETEKFAHVTFFFSGGRNDAFENEDRDLIPSPKVATYDLQPEMSAPEVTEKLLEEIGRDVYDMIILNYANGDMVGHTAKFGPICKAVRTVDACVGKVVEKAREHGYTVLITADHGNADHAVNEDGSPDTAHSLNPVPFIVVDSQAKAVREGRLCDIAPTILHYLGIPQPASMTGECLVEE